MVYQGFYDASKDQRKISFGKNSVETLPEEVGAYGDRALLITSKTIASKTLLADKISDLLGKKLVGVFSETPSHTPRKSVLRATEVARRLEPDCLINLGGGSTTDIAKAVRLALWMGISNLEGFDEARDRLSKGDLWNNPEGLISQISLPTTLVGAEHTSGMGITNEATHSKQVFSHPLLQCKTVILDPELTLYTPTVLWFSTGIKCLEHAVARLSDERRHPVIDSTSALAVSILSKELVASFKHQDNLQARSQLQIACWLSKFGSGAYSGMRMGLSHAVGRQIGSVCGVPHGLSSCVILPLSMEYNAPVCVQGLTMVARSLGVNTVELSGEEVGRAAAGSIRSLIKALGLPGRLRDIGVTKELLPLIAERTMNDWSIGTNPRPVKSAEEILFLLNKAW
jgi:alcohol dehydrogenase class IV